MILSRLIRMDEADWIDVQACDGLRSDALVMGHHGDWTVRLDVVKSKRFTIVVVVEILILTRPRPIHAVPPPGQPRSADRPRGIGCRLYVHTYNLYLA